MGMAVTEKRPIYELCHWRGEKDFDEYMIRETPFLSDAATRGEEEENDGDGENGSAKLLPII